MSHPLPSSDDRWALDLGGIHVTFGDGTLDGVGTVARDLGGTRVLLITDPGLERVGHADRALASLRQAGLVVEVFDGVEENPTTEHVAHGVTAAQAFEPDMLLGLGGGSSMDCCKGINFLYTQGGAMADYWGDGKATRPMLPSIGVPTTAGTGSEGQRFALISDATSHAKMACGDRKARFRSVILDPELVSSMPRDVAAVTGMDAVSHALESFVTRRRNPISQLFAREAWRLLESSLERFLDHPADGRARGRMLLGAHLAGAAIEASMLGAAHSCANPLTAHYGITHGAAVGLMLPHVIRYNAHEVDDLYDELASAARLNGQGATAGERVSHRVHALATAAGLPTRLGDCGVSDAMIPQMAEDAASQWTAQFNPRVVERSDLESLYQSAF